MGELIEEKLKLLNCNALILSVAMTEANGTPWVLSSEI